LYLLTALPVRVHNLAKYLVHRHFRDWIDFYVVVTVDSVLELNTVSTGGRYLFSEVPKNPAGDGFTRGKP
jgi:hypothetical protein